MQKLNSSKNFMHPKINQYTKIKPSKFNLLLVLQKLCFKYNPLGHHILQGIVQNRYIGIALFMKTENMPIIALVDDVCIAGYSIGTVMLNHVQGGGTPIHSVLRAATAVKMKVNSQFKIFSTVNSQATISL